MFPTIEVSGSAFERGRQYGTAARQRVERSVASYTKLFAYCGIGWRDAQRLSHAYEDIIGKLDANLLDEMRGIAAGSGRSFDEILALNARTEILPPTFPERPSDAWLASRLRGRKVDMGECTALSVAPSASATGGTLLAQNWDWLGEQRDALVLLRSRCDDGPDYLTLTEAGMLAKIGLNECGFGVLLNILRSENDGSAAGVPVHVLLRALLDCEDVEDAIECVSGLSFGASSNIHCADAEGARAALELSPGGVHVLHGKGGAFCHTNHFLAPAASSTARELPPSISSVPRYERICEITGAHRGKFGLEDVQRMLRDESAGFLSISRHPDPSLPEFARIESVASVVMDLGVQVMHVAPDVPSKTSYQPVALRAAALAA
jgi:isopenicillin-N N-acyltransferase-like protein